MASRTWVVTGEVLQERQYQIRRWSNTHDDFHSQKRWRDLIVERLKRHKELGEREVLIQIAAMAIAAVETFDRRAALEGEKE